LINITTLLWLKSSLNLSSLGKQTFSLLKVQMTTAKGSS